VTVEAIDGSATEAGDRGTFRFTRTGNLALSLPFSFTLTGTATAGTDYNSITTTLSFPANVATLDRDVVPRVDSRVEVTETVIATIVDTAIYDVGVPASATVVIAD
ncbi:MAG TPA: hypothetical protein VIY56_07130, partial [Vicinamibacterales bacterium]